jgi:ADP-ribose pyrophosphatase YjhB (NUDIX family)
MPSGRRRSRRRPGQWVLWRRLWSRRAEMGRRLDYLDDPDAPEASSLVPSVNVGVLNRRGELLLIRRTDNENWAMPGGAMDIGETIAEAGIRETREETGIDCAIERLVGVYTNPRHVMEYTSNGEVRQECSLVFAARPVGGAVATSSESSEVRWVAPDEVDGLQMHASMRLRIEHVLAPRTEPHIG